MAGIVVIAVKWSFTANRISDIPEIPTDLGQSLVRLDDFGTGFSQHIGTRRPEMDGMSISLSGFS
jgi:hypothetical protein